MAKEIQAVKHNHEHAVLPNLDETGAGSAERAGAGSAERAGAGSAEWAHVHCHAHSYRQGNSQTYVYEHCHAHVHEGGTPKHALADLQPQESARVKQLCGRPSLDGRLEALGLRIGAEISRVQRQADGGFSANVSGQTISLNAAEAASVILEVQQ